MEKALRTSPRASRAPKLAGCTHAGRFPHGVGGEGKPLPTPTALRAANGFLQSLITTQTNERSTPSR